MESQELQELWSKVCQLLQEELNPQVYGTFFENAQVKNVTPVSLKDNRLILLAQHSKPWLINRYTQSISRALLVLTQMRIDVAFVDNAELKSMQEAEDKKPANQENLVMLNPKYTFESFVVGNNNRVAHAAALSVAEAPGETYNPLFIYGGVGLGKTHLMHAIGHYVQSQYPEKKLMYITSENFLNELVAHIQSGHMPAFRERYRNVDILMVDDIQFLAGRDTAQEEFFHTFNELRESGKQIVLSADKAPQDIARLEERLRSRFSWGLPVDINRPDIDTRIAILRKKADQAKVEVPDDVCTLIASNVDSNIRELEGSLTRLIAYMKLTNQPIDLALAQEALHDILEKKAHRVINADLIMKTVCSYFQIKVEDLTGPSRRREVTIPRQIAMYLTREMTSLSLPQIGSAFGDRDHSTVLHACRLVESSMKTSHELMRQVNDIRLMVVEN